MREERQWQIILEMLKAYRLDEPLSRFLKDYYRRHKHMGSNDRRQASAFIYSYFRVKNALNGLDLARQITLASFLCSSQSSPLLDYCMEKYSSLRPEDVTKTKDEKRALLQAIVPTFTVEQVFPFRKWVSEEVDYTTWSRSFLEQPLLWIRIRKKFRKEVHEELKGKNIPFHVHGSGAISLPNRTSLENLVCWKEGYFEVQDLASQLSVNYLNPLPGEGWWDACAASGGKSLALFEKENRVKLTVTDVRPSILENLKKRFHRAGISDYELMECDLSDAGGRLFDGARLFDGIIADVPCSGSGTWARTPEWLSMFNPDDLSHFREVQKGILKNISKYLRPGGTLVYITCSVFTAENESNVSFISKELSLERVSGQYIQCSAEQADTMFVAVFRKTF